MSCRFALVCVASTLSGALRTQDPVRFDAARFAVPVGWTRVESAGRMTLRSEPGDARVEVLRSVAMAVSIEDLGGGLVEEAKRASGFRMEVEPESDRHRFVYSRADSEHQGQFVYLNVLSMAAGGRCVTFTMQTATIAAYEAHCVEFGAMVDGVVLGSGPRLESGEAPLTRYMVDASCDFLGRLVQSPLTDDQRATVESELRESWRTGDRAEIDGLKELLSARDELSLVPEDRRELAREAVLKDALEACRADTGGAGAKMMLAICDPSHQPLCAGEPPLTRQAVDAFAKFMAFAAGRTIDYEGKPGKDVRDQLVSAIAEGYAEREEEQRELIAGMPMTWAALRVAWPGLGADQRAGYVAGWKEVAATEGCRDSVHTHAMLRASQMQFRAMQNIMQTQMNTAHIMASNLGGNTTWVYRW